MMILVWHCNCSWLAKITETRGGNIRKIETDSEHFTEQIFTSSLETAVLFEHELAEYYRKHGLYSEQLVAWKQKCLAANQPKHRQLVNEQRAVRSEETRIRSLEKELRRKDKTLAELAALQELQEKLSALRDNEEGD